MPIRFLKTWVIDGNWAWDTIAEQGIFKLQHNSSPVITNYSYRILRKNNLWPNWIEAHAYGKDEARDLWKKFTGATLD
jgi:hypothetical protein